MISTPGLHKLDAKTAEQVAREFVSQQKAIFSEWFSTTEHIDDLMILAFMYGRVYGGNETGEAVAAHLMKGIK